ncbi:MAG: tRNA (guanosine(37)-N1)-methyltransferase TrmD [Elusimicrobiota bacterium]
MTIDVVTLFPEMVDFPLSLSIIGRARKKGLLKLGFVNPRDFATDNHKTVDSKPYGGGSGMLLMADPVYKAISKVRRKNSYVILLTPKGKVFNQKLAFNLLSKKHIVLICGHYEGIDERISGFIDDEISIGDFILSGGEPAAICFIDCIARLIDGVINKESAKNESFSEYLLEPPQYTRPFIWRNKRVPKVLLSGNHKEIAMWRFKKSIEITRRKRPDLYKKFLEKSKENIKEEK